MIKKVINKFKRYPELVPITIGLAGLGLITSVLLSGNSRDIIKASVTVTNNENTSGGSGVVLDSSDHESIVLTNAHVCELVRERGGNVSNVEKTLRVTYTKVSKENDLCLIKVNGNFGVETVVASKEPVAFKDDALVVGHPNLFPLVMTRGHFSQGMVVQIMVGTKPCEDADYLNPNLGFFCAISGGKKPIIRTYQSTLVTATIMPGSSGSPVYNSKEQLSGLVFAGKGDLGYGLIMPYVAVKRFLENEQQTLDYVQVNQDADLSALLKNSARSIESICKNSSIPICEDLSDDLVWRK